MLLSHYIFLYILSDRTESARLLLQFEADAGTYDNTGQLCLTLMAANMPQLVSTLKHLLNICLPKNSNTMPGRCCPIELLEAFTAPRTLQSVPQTPDYCACPSLRLDSQGIFF